MDRKLMVVSVVAIVALVVAAVALAEAYTVISEYNAKNLASPTFNPMQTAAPASSPSISSQPSATAAATSSINGTEPLSSTLSVSSIYGINTTQTISSGTIYQFTVSINSPQPKPSTIIPVQSPICPKRRIRGANGFAVRCSFGGLYGEHGWGILW